ncbi:MAG: nitrogenase molybdenum-iron protein, partial [Oscillospiraceae bacterium]|nr:nitrogenase molybdenum-iron protein [Oscillospiraceae bacterium]
LCDPGGCSGNVCGYDEPRFYGSTNALFSAAIRDMDVIMGKDDLLARKVLFAASEKNYPFAALIGTPVVSVVATDLNNLCHMVEKKTGIPAVSVDTNGMDFYDMGQSKMYLKLVKKFGALGEGNKSKSLVIGYTPLDMRGLAEAPNWESSVLLGWSADSLEALKNLAEIKESLVLSPSGLAAARELEKSFGIPYRAVFPESEPVNKILSSLPGNMGKTLIVHQQFAANALREKLSAESDVGSWFMLDKEFAKEGDIRFDDEELFIEKCMEYDTVICDEFYFKALKGFKGNKIAFNHFAVSGDLYE